MTPKEKANELYYKYFDVIDKSNPLEDIKNTSKQCALICVEEKKKSLDTWRNTFMGRKQLEKLEKVKQELLKL